MGEEYVIFVLHAERSADGLEEVGNSALLDGVGEFVEDLDQLAHSVNDEGEFVLANSLGISGTKYGY